MSDDELRHLERRFRETGEVADEVAWIVARVRLGALTPARIEVAALCEREAASSMEGRRATLGECADVFGVRPAAVRRWVREGCPAEPGPRFDIVSVLRWRDGRRWTKGKRPEVLLRAIARVDPQAARLARKVADQRGHDAMRPARALHRRDRDGPSRPRVPRDAGLLAPVGPGLRGRCERHARRGRRSRDRHRSRRERQERSSAA